MKAIVKLLLLLGCAALFASCHLLNHGDCCTEISVDVDVIVKNKDGQNLLDTTTHNHYTADSIRLYYLKNGVAKEVYFPLQDAPRNFFIEQTNGEATLRFFADATPSDTETTTLIQWRAGDNSDIDTIYTEMFHFNSSSVTCNKVTYKNKVFYDINTPSDSTGDRFRVVRIVK
ncbi:hypothetical protein SAMN04488109_0028 [Chryseolinea serpens]|uniref:Uncharacterized protein n=1 Tax=Chryseolinea serpens TaxID=947013 RepID=A0A1M5JFG0_9BACT|nr:hypothetical protein [Chryseolinea serpens]SHG39326.1 hypothetical protein SAMN04488109_0028 [Chryseolinea serpens]